MLLSQNAWRKLAAAMVASECACWEVTVVSSIFSILHVHLHVPLGWLWDWGGNRELCHPIISLCVCVCVFGVYVCVGCVWCTYMYVWVCESVSDNTSITTDISECGNVHYLVFTVLKSSWLSCVLRKSFAFNYTQESAPLDLKSFAFSCRRLFWSVLLFPLI